MKAGMHNDTQTEKIDVDRGGRGTGGCSCGFGAVRTEE